MATKTVKVVCPACGSERIAVVWNDPPTYQCKDCDEPFGD